MKILTTFLLSFVMILGAYAQEEEKLSKSELKNMQKEQKKAAQALEREKAAEVTDYMVTHAKFVLEADYLSDKTGSRINVLSQINFIRVDSLNAVVQLGSAMEAGYNGVGGMTTEGTISNYKYSKIGRKKDGYSVSFNMMSSQGTFDISVMVNAGGSADASIRSNWPGVLNYSGRLVPLEVSRVFKGSTTY